MNKIEKLVYDAVKNSPWIKIKIRNLYQSTYDLLPNKKDYFKNPISIKNGYFLGFHDTTPFSYDDKKVLSNKLTIPLRMPTKCDVLEVGYFVIKDGQLEDYVKIGETTAWNYHKGCRLQWAGKNHIIYNGVEEGELISKLFNIHDKSIVNIPFPIDSVSQCGKYATSFSYGRLEMNMPGYGYIQDDESFKSQKITDLTGLFIVNLESGTKDLVVSLQELNEQGNLKESPINEAHQYITHTLFSKDRRYVSFLHRATIIEDHTKRWTQMVVYDRYTKKCYFSPTDEMVSHYVWNEKNQIIAYARINGIDSHILFETPDLNTYRRVAYPLLNSDGHQSFISDTAFVTDTYPDKYRMANLYKVNMENDEVNLLGSFNSMKKFQSKSYRHWCCDLHPRMNRKGDIVCFDSIHTKERALCLMRI